MNQIPLVSIVIPAFSPRFFKDSIQSALSQAWESLEVIVCDDCPDEDIRQILDGLIIPDNVSLRYVRNPSRLGFVANLLGGLTQARGEFVKILCDDDRLFAQCISQQAQALIENEDVSLVLCQRFLVDSNSFILPSRLINHLFNAYDTLFKGGDMLELLHSSPINILGHFSSALVRTVDMQSLLPLLAQEGAGFSALLDFALFICLLRRGNMIMLHTVLSAERLHPDRLSKQEAMYKAAVTERKWLVEMLDARSGERAPAAGWVRAVELSKVIQGQPHNWEEIGLLRAFSNLQTFLQARVGGNSESYEELYKDWLESRRFSAAEVQLMPTTIDAWRSRPRIAVVVTDAQGDASGLALTLESLELQMYKARSIVVLSAGKPYVDEHVRSMLLRDDWAGQLNDVLADRMDVDWVYLLRAGDRLFESTLLVLAERIAHRSGVQCIYSDESALVEQDSHEPVFKPDFNLDLMRSYPYVGRTLALSCEAIRACGGFDSAHGELAPHDLLWKLVESQGPQVIEHIAEMQVASTLSFAQWLSLPEMVEANRQLLGAHLGRIGVEHRLHAGELPLINRVEYLNSAEPLVSIIVQAGKRLSSLQRCIETLLEKTTYSRYEILIVDHADSEPQMTDWLNGMAQLDSRLLRVLRIQAGEFDAAQLKNQAANQARGDYLLFLSPDALIISASWLSELLNHARRPEVGVVGGRILSTQGTIIQVGLIMGLGGAAGSPFAGEPVNAPGYMQRLQVTQNWSAISGDCLMLNKEVFERAGQFDAGHFPLSLHDVDLCLRIARQGYLMVGTPYSIIALDMPSAAFAPEWRVRRQAEQEALYQRWAKVMANDPAYNPNLSLAGGNFSLFPGLKTGWSPFCSRTLPSILILPINSSAVGHYRVIQPLAALQAAGRVIGQSMFDSPSIIDIERIAPDVIVLQCRYASHSPDYIASLKKYSSALRIFELDDYVINAPKKNAHVRNKSATIGESLRKSIALCDRVVVSSPALKRALADMHDDIRVVPNMLVPGMWTGLSSRRRTSSRPRVGWGGGTSHTGDLEIIAEVVRELANDVEWVFFGMCPDELRPYIHEFHPVVGLQAYPAKLASLNLDLALAPLEFHIFNDCKSNLRLLEYGACGYPVICTDTEAYRGFLPCTRVKTNSTAEWLEAIKSHLADPDASYRMGDELRESVLQNFMLAGDNLKHWEWGWLPD